MGGDFCRRHPLAIPCGVAVAMLLGALGRWPYGYYQLLRLVTCGAAVYGAYVSHSLGKTGWLWAFVFVAVLFNPIIPVYLTREIWRPMNVGCAGLFVVAVLAVRPRGGR